MLKIKAYIYTMFWNTPYTVILEDNLKMPHKFIMN